MSFGCLVEREGSNHTVFINPSSGQVTTVPRHNEIKTFLGKKICRDLGLPPIKLK